MKKFIKLISKYSAITFIALTFCIGTVSAATTYSSWSNYVYWNTWIGLSGQTKSSSSSKSVTIDWQDAEASNFKMNFRILNSDLKEIESARLNYLATSTFTASTVSGREYLLQGLRDGYFTPRVYIKGRWKIN